MTALPKDSLYRRPVIRAHLSELLYVRQFHHPHTPSVQSLKGPIMRHCSAHRRITRGNLAIAVATLITCIIITLFAVQGSPSSRSINEDDPRWVCSEMGNKVCGDPEGKHATEAWETWDRMSGWQHLKVDPSKATRVDYVGTALTPPHTANDEAALPAEDGSWFVFRATVID